jgi:DUF1365 family protein
MTQAALYAGAVVHTRLRPVRHRLRSRMFALLLDLDSLPSIAASLRWFSLDRFNLFGFCARDHLAGTAMPLRAQIEAAMAEAGLTPDGGAIAVLCMPRVLGLVFNPLSLFFCHDRAGALRAVLYEVNNTFGQRHTYLLPVADADSRPIRQECDKVFHVSPFMDMDLRYRFRLMPPTENYAGKFAIAIDVADRAGTLFTAGFAAPRQKLTDATLLRAFLRQPLLAIHVLGGIHWEALKLWRKGMRLRPRPEPPLAPISIPGPA